MASTSGNSGSALSNFLRSIKEENRRRQEEDVVVDVPDSKSSSGARQPKSLTEGGASTPTAVAVPVDSKLKGKDVELAPRGKAGEAAQVNQVTAETIAKQTVSAVLDSPPHADADSGALTSSASGRSYVFQHSGETGISLAFAGANDATGGEYLNSADKVTAPKKSKSSKSKLKSKSKIPTSGSVDQDSAAVTAAQYKLLYSSVSNVIRGNLGAFAQDKPALVSSSKGSSKTVDRDLAQVIPVYVDEKMHEMGPDVFKLTSVYRAANINGPEEFVNRIDAWKAMLMETSGHMRVEDTAIDMAIRETDVCDPKHKVKYTRLGRADVDTLGNHVFEADPVPIARSLCSAATGKTVKSSEIPYSLRESDETPPKTFVIHKQVTYGQLAESAIYERLPEMWMDTCDERMQMVAKDNELRSAGKTSEMSGIVVDSPLSTVIPAEFWRSKTHGTRIAMRGTLRPGLHSSVKALIDPSLANRRIVMKNVHEELRRQFRAIPTGDPESVIPTLATVNPTAITFMPSGGNTLPLPSMAVRLALSHNPQHEVLSPGSMSEDPIGRQAYIFPPYLQASNTQAEPQILTQYAHVATTDEDPLDDNIRQRAALYVADDMTAKHESLREARSLGLEHITAEDYVAPMSSAANSDSFPSYGHILLEEKHPLVSLALSQNDIKLAMTTDIYQERKKIPVPVNSVTSAAIHHQAILKDVPMLASYESGNPPTVHMYPIFDESVEKALDEIMDGATANDYIARYNAAKNLLFDVARATIVSQSSGPGIVSAAISGRRAVNAGAQTLAATVDKSIADLPVAEVHLPIQFYYTTKQYSALSALRSIDEIQRDDTADEGLPSAANVGVDGGDNVEQEEPEPEPVQPRNPLLPRVELLSEADRQAIMADLAVTETMVSALQVRGADDDDDRSVVGASSA